MRLEPTNIQQIGDELAIAWNDGSELFFHVSRWPVAPDPIKRGGERVSFDISLDRNGRKRADNIAVL